MLASYSVNNHISFLERSISLSTQRNDDTKTKLGDIFHYYLVLEQCLNLQENESIVVETYGDISIVSENDSANMEIKQHLNEHYLSDRHIDFWKSLKNWVENHENMKQFKSLVLFTTSKISATSRLADWNKKSSSERLCILKDIGANVKEQEKAFRPLYDKIFSYEEELILDVIERIVLQTEMENVTTVRKRIKSNPFFKLVPDKDQEFFINTVMGYILEKPSSYPHTWSISFKDFSNTANEIRDRLASQTRPLPRNPQNQNPINYNAFNHRDFVQAIREIDYEDAVHKAIASYCRTHELISNMCVDNPIFLVDINEYKDDLEDKLTVMKGRSKRGCDINNLIEVIKHSKDLYDEAMLLPPEPFGSISPNRSFFQQGIMHTIVEERTFKWNLVK